MRSLRRASTCETLDAALAALGGDSRSRARELDLLRYQVDELAAADLQDPDEDERLEAEEDALAGVVAHREAAMQALDALGEDGARDALSVGGRRAGRARARSASRTTAWWRSASSWTTSSASCGPGWRLWRRTPPASRRFAPAGSSCTSCAGSTATRWPMSWRTTQRPTHGWPIWPPTTSAWRALEAERAEALAAEAAAASAVGTVRRAAAPELGRAVQSHLGELAMGKAQVEVTVSEDPEGREVAFLLAANLGEPPLPMAKVASGGELARAMLALRLVLTEAPETLLFDEVDAGIGGEAALAVGRALAGLGQRHQVLVVTHLAQVAAFAERQIVVDKHVTADRTRAVARAVEGDDRVVELARMLSGMSESGSARLHALELLDGARAVAGS